MPLDKRGLLTYNECTEAEMNLTKANNRDKARNKRKHGMRVDGTSNRLLFRLGIEGKPQKRKGGR